jgi:hypothetical protein
MRPEGGARGGDPEPSLRKVLLQDLRETRVHRTFGSDLRAIYRFYLDDEERSRLESMGRIRRALFLVPRILKSLLFKLSPARRLMMLVALVFAAFRAQRWQWGSAHFSIDLTPWAFLMLLVVLMLELKDKLLAKEEIEVARQVQIALLPSEHPQPEGWSVWSTTRPANDVGGDLVDSLAHSGRLGMALGDVAGKGLGAALLMAKLQATLRALVPECASLASLGERLNAILNRDGLENRFATLFYLEVTPGSGRVRYLNAGHNPPLVLRRDGRVERIAASSVPLGMFPSATYEEGSMDLLPGEALVAYSDGLVEATNAADEEFGLERLERSVARLRAVPVPVWGKEMLAELEAFLGGGKPADDVSLLVVRRS